MARSEDFYNPFRDGDPEEFIKRPDYWDMSYDMEHKVSRRRHSSVLTAAFTPLIRSFCEKLTSLTPEESENTLKGLTPTLHDYHHHYNFNKHIFRTVKDEELEAVESYAAIVRMTDEYKGPVEHEVYPYIVVPIGTYGQEFANTVARSSLAVARQMEGMIGQESWQLLQSPYREAIHRDTFREVPEYSMEEGMQTIAASIGLLTSKGVSGFENDPIGGMRHLVDHKIFQYFAAHSPNGIIVPMAQRGYGFPEPLSTDKAGNAMLSASMKQMLDEEKPYKIGKLKGSLGEGCPVAREHTPNISPTGEEEIIDPSGVQMMMEAYMPYLEYYYAKEPIIYP